MDGGQTRRNDHGKDNLSHQHEGGVGKSTLAANLAWHFAGYTTWSKNVLVVDLDPRFNASQYMLGAVNYGKHVSTPNRPTVWDVFKQRTRTPSGPAPKAVVPEEAIINVITYTDETTIALLASRLELAWSLKQPAEKEGLLAQFLKKVVYTLLHGTRSELNREAQR